MKIEKHTATSMATPRHPLRTVAELLGESIRRHGGSVAVVAPGRPPLTQAALGAQLRETADALATAGHARGARIAVSLPDGPEFAIAVLAVCCAATCAPLNEALDEDSLVHVLTAMRIDAIVVADGVDSNAARAARRIGLPVLRLRSSPQMCAGAFELIVPVHGASTAPRLPGLDDIAFLTHTSGTTGAPKIVPFEHWRVAEAARSRADLERLDDSNRCLVLMPPYSMGCIRRSLLPPLLVGGSIACLPERDGSTIVDALVALAPTHYLASPVTHAAILDEFERRSPRPPHSLRFVNSSNAVLSATLRRRLEQTFGVPVIVSYGMTETGTIAQTRLPPERAPESSVGRRADNEVAVADDSGTLLAAGETGEIVVRGAEVCSGYENDEAANRAAYRDGWFRTGDAGRIDRDGYVFLVGRIKDIINRGGVKIVPAEVEAALLQHPQVAEAAAFAVPHPTLGEDVAAAVVVRGASVDERALRRFARARLAAFKTPSRIFTVAALPRAALGKLDRKALARLAQRDADFDPPRTPAETAVARIFAEVLDVPAVGRSENFFHAGGDSLRGVRALASVDSDFGVAVTLDLLLDHPTVAEFAAQIVAQLESLEACR